MKRKDYRTIIRACRRDTRRIISLPDDQRNAARDQHREMRAAILQAIKEDNPGFSEERFMEELKSGM